MHAELAVGDLGQQHRAGTATRDWVRRRGRLGDRLTGSAGELLADVLANEPARGNAFECLGDVLAELVQAAGAARACRRAGIDVANTRQMLWQRAARRFAAAEGRDRGVVLGSLFDDADRGERLLDVFECEFELANPGARLGRLAESLAPRLGQLETEPFEFEGKHDVVRVCLGDRKLRGQSGLAFDVPGGPLCEDHRMGRGKVCRKRFKGRAHPFKESRIRLAWEPSPRLCTTIPPRADATSSGAPANRSHRADSRAAPRRSSLSRRPPMARESGRAPAASRTNTCLGHRAR